MEFKEFGKYNMAIIYNLTPNVKCNFFKVKT